MLSPQMQQPNPALLFQTINFYQRTEALKAAIEWKSSRELVNERRAQAIAERTSAAERGIPILCDFLCIMGFLNKLLTVSTNTRLGDVSR